MYNFELVGPGMGKQFARKKTVVAKSGHIALYLDHHGPIGGSGDVSPQETVDRLYSLYHKLWLAGVPEWRMRATMLAAAGL